MNITELRAYAKKEARSGNLRAFRSLATDDLARLVVELESRQIDLERQNQLLRNTQQRLLAAKEQYAELYDNAPIGLVTTDANGIILQTNQTFSRIVHAKGASLVGQSLSAFVFREDVNDYDRTRHNTINSGHSDNCELRFCTLSGELIWVRLDCMFTNKSGGQCRLVICDISSQKTAESRLRKQQNLKGIKNLAEGIAGELNQIMTVLFGNLSMARMKLAEDHPALKFIEKSEHSINRAEQLSYQLRQIAKESEPRKEITDLARLIAESLETHFSNKDLSFDLQNPTRLWSCFVDKKQMQKVLANLFANATQAMPEKDCFKVTLSNVSLSEHQVPGLNQGRYIKAILTDGRKIDERQDFGSLFDAGAEGLVIGKQLEILTVYSIINSHGGYLGVESQPERGLSFILYIPAAL